MENVVFGLACRLGTVIPPVIKPLAAVTAAAATDVEYVAASRDVFVSPRRVRFTEMEYAIGFAIERSDLHVSFPRAALSGRPNRPS